MPILTKRFGASTFQEVFTRRWTKLLRLVSASGIFLDTLQPRVLEDCGSEGGAAFGVGLARSLLLCGNYIGLPSNTALFLFTGNKYLFLFQHHLIPCDS